MSFTIARCSGNHASTDLEPWEIDTKSLVNSSNELIKPVMGSKDGSYFLRCNGTHRSNAGTDDIAHILILDGDSRINEDGEIVSGAPCPAEVSEVLTKLDVTHCIYSSYSNAATLEEITAKGTDSGGLHGKDYYKYRVIIPCSYTPEQLPSLLDYIFNKLHRDGVMLENVKENRTWSQPWYFPRTPDADRLDLFESYQYAGSILNADVTHSQWEKSQPPRVEPKQNPDKFKIDESNGRINSMKVFNQTFSVHEILSRNGYIKKGHKWLRPDSESKIPSVQLCTQCNDGKERIYSHGGDVLNDGYAHDAWDCYRFLELGETSPTPTVNAFNWNIDIQKHNREINRQEEKAAKKAQQPPIPIQAQDSYIEKNIDYSSMPDFEEVGGESEPDKTGQKQTSFKFANATELMNRAYAPDFLIKTLFESNALGQIFGATGSGKSFVVLDMAYCIAAGLDYHGLAVKQGNVAYICGEGFRAIGRRVKALQNKYDADVDGKLFISEQPGAFIDIGITSEVAEAIKEIGNVNLVIIDTYHRNMGGGNENSADDFGLVLRNIDAFIKPLNVAVLIVHHSGHMETNRSRGSSAIRAAMDFEYQVDKNSDTVTLKPTKIKDGITPPPMHFTLVDSEIGLDHEGNAITSAYLDSKACGDKTGQDRTKRKLSARDDAILQTLNDAITSHGIEPSAEIKAKFGGFDSFTGKLQKIVHIDHWRDLAHKTISVDADTEEKRAASLQKAFKRCRDKLFNDKYTVEHGQYVWRFFEEKES